MPLYDPGLPSGTAFPSSPATGNYFYRTDKNIFCYYNGTNWISQATSYFPLHNYRGSPPWSATEEALAASISTSYPPYFIQWAPSFYIDGLNDGSNYWTLTLRRQDINNFFVTVATFDTSGYSGGTWSEYFTSTFSTQPQITDYWVQLYIETTGAPDPIFITNSILTRVRPV